MSNQAMIAWRAPIMTTPSRLLRVCASSSANVPLHAVPRAPTLLSVNAQVPQPATFNITLALTVSANPVAGSPVIFTVMPPPATIFAANISRISSLYYGFQEDASALTAAKFSNDASSQMLSMPTTFSATYASSGTKAARLRVYDANPYGAPGTYIAIAEAVLTLVVSGSERKRVCNQVRALAAVTGGLSHICACGLHLRTIHVSDEMRTCVLADDHITRLWR